MIVPAYIYQVVALYAEFTYFITILLNYSIKISSASPNDCDHIPGNCVSSFQISKHTVQYHSPIIMESQLVNVTKFIRGTACINAGYMVVATTKQSGQKHAN